MKNFIKKSNKNLQSQVRIIRQNDLEFQNECGNDFITLQGTPRNYWPVAKIFLKSHRCNCSPTVGLPDEDKKERLYG